MGDDGGGERDVPVDGDGEDSLEDDEDVEEEPFDITLPASHSYMGPGLVAVSGRCVLEPGWRGRVPAAAHHGTVFPGETVPMLVTNTNDAGIIARAINTDKLFGLLCPDETGTVLSGYGVLCEVFEATCEAESRAPVTLTVKARATHRVRLVDMPRHAPNVHLYARMRLVEVCVLPEVCAGEPLRRARLASLDARRHASGRAATCVRRLDAALTPWPPFVYDIFDYRRMRTLIQDYFSTIRLDKLPEDPVSLSFWVASNLALSARDRLALFAADHALLRLHMELRFIARRSVLCCSSCMAEIARRENIFAMSSEGVHSNYTNLGGYMHDIVTVRAAANTVVSGAPSPEYSWFPGYAWSILLCADCRVHVGWRFDAMKRSLRPQRFYGLCRNTVQPRADDEREHEHEHERRRHARSRSSSPTVVLLPAVVHYPTAPRLQHGDL